MPCSKCGGNRIEEGIKIGASADPGIVGPKYNARIIVGVTQMYCDLCLDCGEILRFCIKDTSNRNWSKVLGSLFPK